MTDDWPASEAIRVVPPEFAPWGLVTLLHFPPVSLNWCRLLGINCISWATLLGTTLLGIKYFGEGQTIIPPQFMPITARSFNFPTLVLHFLIN